MKSILVQMDSSPRILTRLKLASELAVTHDGAVTALYPAGPNHQRPGKRGALPGELVPAAQALQDQRIAAVRALFDQSVAAGATRATWATVLGEPARAFARQALCADLLVLGQSDPEEDNGLPPDFAESVLLGSGKPAIVVPYIGLLSPVGGVVLVAWKESPESARALTAAMPFLSRASAVHIATWDDPNPPSQPEAAVDVVAYLARHGVEARMKSQGPATRELGEQLLSLTVDVGAGLLVMGCYGQSRAREWVLGGVTRTVLQAMSTPVLMSH